jgi:hypothetical protein
MYGRRRTDPNPVAPFEIALAAAVIICLLMWSAL